MYKIAEFFPVSGEQFKKDFVEKFPNNDPNLSEEEYLEAIELMHDFVSTLLPKRSTKGSAGYDFYSPFSFDLAPDKTITIPTGMRCEIDPGWVLMMFPRSGLGFRYHCTLANTVGIIDSDYFYADNEGHIMVKLVNRGTINMHIEAGDKICQGVFLLHGITHNDSASGERHGGFGSTGK